MRDTIEWMRMFESYGSCRPFASRGKCVCLIAPPLRSSTCPRTTRFSLSQFTSLLFTGILSKQLVTVPDTNIANMVIHGSAKTRYSTSLPSPETVPPVSACSSPYCKNPDVPYERLANKSPTKRLPDYARVDIDCFTRSGPDDMQLKIGKSYLDLSNAGKMQRLAGLRNLTSINSPALLPWHVMCLSTLKTCIINLEVDRCARGDRTLLDGTIKPMSISRVCPIEKLSVHVPLEILYHAYSRHGLFQYLPTITALMPYLRYLALHLTRNNQANGMYPRSEDLCASYDSLLEGMHSSSIETLVIDTCDVDPASVRDPREDFFECIAPITSLAGFPSVRRIVAPQEAFISVSGGLGSDLPVSGITSTQLFSQSIEVMEIIDSTTTLEVWAYQLLDA
jgi:hypothetical protein